MNKDKWVSISDAKEHAVWLLSSAELVDLRPNTEDDLGGNFEFISRPNSPILLQIMYRWLLFFDSVPSELIEEGKVPNPDDLTAFYAANENDANSEMYPLVREAFLNGDFQQKLNTFRAETLYGMNNIEPARMRAILRTRWNQQ